MKEIQNWARCSLLPFPNQNVRLNKVCTGERPLTTRAGLKVLRLGK
jgi:hypothetical protein